MIDSFRPRRESVEFIECETKQSDYVFITCVFFTFDSFKEIILSYLKFFNNNYKKYETNCRYVFCDFCIMKYFYKRAFTEPVKYGFLSAERIHSLLPLRYATCTVFVRV